MSTPVNTPPRPARSIDRLTLNSISTSSDIMDTAAPTTPTTSAGNDQSSGTDESPRNTTHPSARKKKNGQSRRKPVPPQSGGNHQETSLEMSNLNCHSTETSSGQSPSRVHDQVHCRRDSTTSTQSRLTQPPMYILPVDPPLPQSPTSEEDHHETPQYQYPYNHTSTTSVVTIETLPPSYPSPAEAHINPLINRDVGASVETGFGGTLGGNSSEDLPRYAEENQTEPKTLVKGLWRWGFICPLLWILGICILFSPLTTDEGETDPEKAQKIQEMIAILRKTELKYARRCAIAFSMLVAIVVVIVVICVAVTVKRG